MGDVPHDRNAELKARVRKDFETTDASVRSLAARHGIKSENTIRRWIKQDGWVRNIQKITANLVTRAIALPDEPKPQPDKPSDSENKPPKTSKRTKACASQAASSATIVPFPNTSKSANPHLRTGEAGQNQGTASEAIGTAHNAHTPCAPAHSQNTGASAEGYDRIEIDTARALADIHVAAIRKHSALADKVMGMAEAMIEAVTAIAGKSPDDVSVALARQRLTGINMEKETLAMLARAAAFVAQTGITLQRKVLGMDAIGPPGLSPALPVEKANKGLSEFIPTDLLHQLRDVAKARSMVRPDVAKTGPSIEHEQSPWVDPPMPPDEVGAEPQDESEETPDA